MFYNSLVNFKPVDYIVPLSWGLICGFLFQSIRVVVILEDTKIILLVLILFNNKFNLQQFLVHNNFVFSMNVGLSQFKVLITQMSDRKIQEVKWVPADSSNLAVW